MTMIQKAKQQNFLKKIFKDPRYPDPYTIDLVFIKSQEYCNSRNWGIWQKILQLWLVTFTILWMWYSTSFFIPEVSAADYGIREQIREERLEICTEAFRNSWIKHKFIYEQLMSVRCATYMSLIYAYESGYGSSRMCIEDKNCFGIKGNWYDTPAGFLKFKTEREGREYFARKYFDFHYKKNIETFVRDWSMTDRATYISFMRSKYFDLYMQLEKQYLF